MARKYDLITELYSRTCQSVISSPKNWQAFLSSACRNYKLRFDEQLLIYAQRPDATAVLEIEQWNRNFGRWVNRGAKGIAVFDDMNRNKQRLKHYFDISDTHESRNTRPVPIWSMKPEYGEEVIEALEGTFGELPDREDLASAIVSAANIAAEDHAADYMHDLLLAKENSLLADFDESSLSYLFKKLVGSSVAFMIMERLGLPGEQYIELDDVNDVIAFSTPETLNFLGFATSDIAEMGLAEIAKTIMSIEVRNRTIAEKQESPYNKIKEQKERSLYNDRDDLHDAGRLQSAESDLAETTGDADRSLRTDESEVSEREQESSVLQSSDRLPLERAPNGGGTDSERDDRTSDEGTSGERRRDGDSESNRHDELGSEDEQYPEQSSGSSPESSDFRLDYYDRRNEDRSLPFFGGDDTIREILGTTPHLKASKDEIRTFYEAIPDTDKRTEYIKSIFNNDFTEVILSDGRRVGYKTFQNVLHLWEGSYLSRTKQSYYNWAVIAAHFEAMRLFGELQDTIKPLPSMEEQISLMTELEAEVTQPSAFSFSQEIIDTVLCRGSQISEGKMRIYEQFQKSLSKKENVDFLKHEYGWGGSCPIIVGTGIDEMHDGKGISLSRTVNGEAVQEVTRTEFDQMIRENPMNDHLKVLVVSDPEEILVELNPDDAEILDDTVLEELVIPSVPVWEQPKRSKVQSFDLHPDISMAERHNFDLVHNEIEEVGKKERFRRNMEAISVLKNCESEDRFATPEEQIILSKYVGWGGIPEAFEENNSAWANEYLELREALSSDEYAAARESTLTAFYTPPTVIQAVYKAMEQMGFREGNILEPSCGIGHFIGMLPESMRDSKIYGVELDPISAGIAQQLYQKTSIAAQPFEEINLPDSFFDAVVGNVPFGDFKVLDKRYDKHKFLIHDYFFGATRS